MGKIILSGFYIFFMSSALFSADSDSHAKGVVTLNPPVPGLGSKMEMEVVQFNPPIVFFGDKLLEGNPPIWAKSDLWALNLTSADIPLYFDDSYIKEYGNPQLNRKPPAIYTGVYFGIKITIGEENYMLVGSAYSEEKSKLLGRGAAVGVLKKYGDKWKYTAEPSWRSSIPSTNLSDVFCIIERGSAILDSLNQLKATEPEAGGVPERVKSDKKAGGPS